MGDNDEFEIENCQLLKTFSKKTAGYFLENEKKRRIS